MSEDGEDGEDRRVVVAHYGPASCRHDVVSLQHQVVQRLLWTDEGTGSRLNMMKLMWRQDSAEAA